MSLGTTSACAENTVAAFTRSKPWRNYLRVRGEYAGTRMIACLRSELPPRARRIQVVEFFLRCPGGTTSACAENTLNCCAPRAALRNYLRVRGEYWLW